MKLLLFSGKSSEKQAEIEVFVNNQNIITQLTRVDFAEFHISTTSKIPPGIKFNLFCIAIQEKSSFAPH
jgi:hypothetical protein